MCEEGGYHINCSGSGLSSIPLILPTHVQELLLDNIRITIFENDSFVSKGLVELEALQADYCKIRKIEMGAFNGLTMLTQLSMRGNEISEIIPGTFGKVSRLDLLCLDQNRIDQLDSETFYGLVSLKNIGLAGNKLQYLNPDTFAGLPNLRGLYLSNNIGLQIPTGRNFIKSHSLKHLIMSGCNVSSVSVETFAYVSALKVLDLSYNYLRSLDINILEVLPELSELNLEGNKISEIIPGTFEKISRLECLHLDYNKIGHIGSDTFRGLVNLRNISLEGTKLQYLHPDAFVELPYLQRLILSKNSDLQIPTDHHFINSRSLKHLDISGCNVSSISVQSFAKASTLESIDLRYNCLRILDIGILKVLPELFAINMKWNEISEIIPDASEKVISLKYLFLDYNKIERLESDTFRGLFNLNYIGLMANNLKYLHPDAFFGLPNLEGLLLSSNSGLKIPTDRHFINSHSLKRLVISGCNINSVSNETFANVSALEVLDLSETNLRRVDINILKALPQLSALYLYGNPLQCDCQLQEVWRWCVDHNIQRVYMEFAPECDTPNEVKGIWLGVLEKGQCLQGNIHYYGDYNNTRYNYTPIKDTDTETEKKTFIQQYKFPISAILFIFGAISNVVLIIIITCNKDMRTVPNMYILNLAISDVIYLTGLFSDIWPEHSLRQNGFIMCSFTVFCYRMPVGLTAYSITVLSILRYRVTVNPLQFRVCLQPTWRTTGATLCGVWILAALCAVPEVRSRSSCGAIIVSGVTNYYHYVIIFDLLTSCVIPLCVIAFFHIKTARHLVKTAFYLPAETQNPHLNKRKKTAKIVLGLTVIFLISYLPFYFWKTFLYYSINYDISGDSVQDKRFWFNSFQDVATILYFLLLINSCLNPVALFCSSLAFRRQLKRYLTCC
jgi:Leucine-rich repeat (LRR) protein